MRDRSDIAIVRDQQLANLREQTGTPERIAVEFACSVHDRSFGVTFARLSAAQRFRCESIEKGEDRKASMLERMQGLFKRDAITRFRADEVDFGSVVCAWCAARVRWTLCARCKAFVCSERIGERFTCRKSCGASFTTAPLESLEAGRQVRAGGQLAIGRTRQTLLTGRKR